MQVALAENQLVSRVYFVFAFPPLYFPNIPQKEFEPLHKSPTSSVTLSHELPFPYLPFCWGHGGSYSDSNTQVFFAKSKGSHKEFWEQS